MKSHIKLLFARVQQSLNKPKVVRENNAMDLLNLDTGEQDEIERLNLEMAEVEYRLGELLVCRDYTGIKTRMTTRARRHLRAASYTPKSQWIAEARGYVRYCCHNQDRHAASVMAMLMPFDLRYQEAQIDFTNAFQKQNPLSDK